MINTFPFSGSNNWLYLPFVPTFTLTGSDDQGNPEYEENELNPRKYIYADDITINGSYSGNTELIQVNDGRLLSSMPLVYFEKDKDQSFDEAAAPLDKYKNTLSFGRLRDLNIDTYGYDSLVNKVSILDSNYSLQRSILNKPIYLEIYLKLSAIDFKNIDFFTPIWLSFGLDSGHYYIDEISQYKGANESTKVKLVKI